MRDVITSRAEGIKYAAGLIPASTLGSKVQEAETSWAFLAHPALCINEK